MNKFLVLLVAVIFSVAFTRAALADPPIWESDFGGVMNALTGEDDAEIMRGLGGTFPFEGFAYTGVFVGTNGCVQLGTLGADNDIDYDLWEEFETFYADDDGVGDPEPVICPMGSDWDNSTEGTVHFNQLGNRWVITWNEVGTDERETHTSTFQVQLFTDGTIVFGYNGILDDPGEDLLVSLGEGIVVGISLSDGTYPTPEANPFDLNGGTFIGGDTIYERWCDEVANTCGEGDENLGWAGPDNSAWDLDQQTVIFSPLAQGGFRVTSTGSGFMADSGISGSFSDSNYNGQGINIEVLAKQAVGKDGKGAPGVALVYWYSFDAGGFPFFAFGVGDVVGDTISVDMLFDHDGNGPFFGPDWDAGQFEAADFVSATITATDCDNLLFAFDPDDPGTYPAHPMIMARLTDVAGVPCPALAAGKLPAAPAQRPSSEKGFFISDGMSGSFYDPAFNGQGINTEILVGQSSTKGDSPGVVLLYWYSFDPSGLPFFAFGVGSFTGDTMTVDMLIDYDGTGPFFGPSWDVDQLVLVPFATVTIVWSGCNVGAMSFVMEAAFAGAFAAHPMDLERLTSIAGLACP